MQNKIYSRIIEERLIERYKKEFFQKTGKKLLINDYLPTGLPYPIIGLNDLQDICEWYLPVGHNDLTEKTRSLNIVYPRMIFCNIAYAMGYSICSIAQHVERDRSSVYSAIDTIDRLMTTNFSEVVELYHNIVEHINRTHNGTTIQTMSDVSDHSESAVSTALL